MCYNANRYYSMGLLLFKGVVKPNIKLDVNALWCDAIEENVQVLGACLVMLKRTAEQSNVCTLLKVYGIVCRPSASTNFYQSSPLDYTLCVCVCPVKNLKVDSLISTALLQGMVDDCSFLKCVYYITVWILLMWCRVWKN